MVQSGKVPSVLTEKKRLMAKRKRHFARSQAKCPTIADFPLALEDHMFYPRRIPSPQENTPLPVRSVWSQVA